MQITTSFEALQLTAPGYVTVGAFDGLHRGHQHLISGMVQAAQANNAQAVVVTFHPHPAIVFGRRPPQSYLTTVEDKLAILEQLGVDVVVQHPFDLQVSQMRAADFLSRMQQHLNLAAIWVGRDFAIGHKREGNLAWLQAQQAEYGFAVQVVDPIDWDGEVVRSSHIRSAITNGAVEHAETLLGRPYRLRGTVVQGQQRGRTIGFPTANLRHTDDLLTPANGVYACWAAVDGHPELYRAAVNIGLRPTFDEQQTSIEAYLLDFSGDLYGETVTLSFKTRLRPEQKFDGIDALIAQITQDVAATRQHLPTHPTKSL